MLPFRLKLTLLVLLVCLISGGGAVFVLQQRLLDYFSSQLQGELLRYKAHLLDLLQRQDQTLVSVAASLGQRPQVRQVLGAEAAQVLPPEFANGVDFVAVFNARAQLAAYSQDSEPLAQLTLQQQAWLQRVLRGEAGASLVSRGGQSFRLMAVPVYQSPLRAVAGIVVTGQHLRWQGKASEGFENYNFALFDPAAGVLSVGELLHSSLAQNEFLTALQTTLRSGELSGSRRSGGNLSLGGQRFVYHVATPMEGLPYLLLLRARLTPDLYWFVGWEAGLTLFVCLGLSLWLGTLFAEHTIDLLRRLQKGVEQVERENYAYRVQALGGGDELALLGESFNEMLQNLEERSQVCEAMGQIVSKQLAYEIMRNREQVHGARKPAVVLVANIRDFSHIATQFGPTDLLAFLNNYFTRLSYCVDGHGGLVNTYLGDTLLALFGVPLTHADDKPAAVLAALEMLEALQLFNLEVAAEHGLRLKIGIGIYDGELVAGNIGAENRLIYSVIGDSVKLATRLQDLGREYGASIVISEGVYEALQTSQATAQVVSHCRQLDKVCLGRSDNSVRIYEVLPRHRYLPQLDGLLRRFHTAQVQFEQQEYTDACATLRSLRSDWPEDRPTQLLARRCRYMVEARALTSPPPSKPPSE